MLIRSNRRSTPTPPAAEVARRTLGRHSPRLTLAPSDASDLLARLQSPDQVLPGPLAILDLAKSSPEIYSYIFKYAGTFHGLRAAVEHVAHIARLAPPPYAAKYQFLEAQLTQFPLTQLFSSTISGDPPPLMRTSGRPLSRLLSSTIVGDPPPLMRTSGRSVVSQIAQMLPSKSAGESAPLRTSGRPRLMLKFEFAEHAVLPVFRASSAEHDATACGPAISLFDEQEIQDFENRLVAWKTLIRAALEMHLPQTAIWITRDSVLPELPNLPDVVFGTPLATVDVPDWQSSTRDRIRGLLAGEAIESADTPASVRATTELVALKYVAVGPVRIWMRRAAQTGQWPSLSWVKNAYDFHRYGQDPIGDKIADGRAHRTPDLPPPQSMYPLLKWLLAVQSRHAAEVFARDVLEGSYDIPTEFRPIFIGLCAQYGLASSARVGWERYFGPWAAPSADTPAEAVAEMALHLIPRCLRLGRPYGPRVPSMPDGRAFALRVAAKLPEHPSTPAERSIIARVLLMLADDVAHGPVFGLEEQTVMVCGVPASSVAALRRRATDLAQTPSLPSSRDQSLHSILSLRLSPPSAR